MRFWFPLACASVWCATAGLVAQTPPPQPETFLRQQLAFTAGEFESMESGEIVVKLPRTPETREVAAFAMMRLDVSADFFVNRVHDIVNFKKSDNVLQIGKFANPPRLEDLDGLTLEPAEIEAMKRCRVNRCELKMSAAAIERFRKEVNWAQPDYGERATQLAREILFEHVTAYLRGGNAALGEYNDKSRPVRLAEEFQSLLKSAPYMYGYTPELETYLKNFPDNRPGHVEDFVYWSKEKFGLKPVVSMTHITIYKSKGPHGLDVLIASKGIYANHYYEGSLGLTGFIQSQRSQPDRSYLIYINRSRTDALRGLFAGFKRALISGSLRDGAKKNMEMIKLKLESEYRK